MGGWGAAGDGGGGGGGGGGGLGVRIPRPHPIMEGPFFSEIPFDQHIIR